MLYIYRMYYYSTVKNGKIVCKWIGLSKIYTEWSILDPENK